MKKWGSLGDLSRTGGRTGAHGLYGSLPAFGQPPAHDEMREPGQRGLKAKRRLEAALARFPHSDDVEVIWRAFELDPGAPAVADARGPHAEWLARKSDCPFAEFTMPPRRAITLIIRIIIDIAI